MYQTNKDLKMYNMPANPSLHMSVKNFYKTLTTINGTHLAHLKVHQPVPKTSMPLNNGKPY